MKVVTVVVNGKTVEWVKFCLSMDDNLVTELYRTITPCTEQQAADAYCQAHLAHFGQPYEVED